MPKSSATTWPRSKKSYRHPTAVRTACGSAVGGCISGCACSAATWGAVTARRAITPRPTSTTRATRWSSPSSGGRTGGGAMWTSSPSPSKVPRISSTPEPPRGQAAPAAGLCVSGSGPEVVAPPRRPRHPWQRPRLPGGGRSGSARGGAGTGGTRVAVALSVLCTGLFGRCNPRPAVVHDSSLAPPGVLWATWCAPSAPGHPGGVGHPHRRGRPSRFRLTGTPAHKATSPSPPPRTSGGPTW